MKSVQLEDFNAPLGSSIRRFYIGNSASFYPPQGALTAFVDPATAIPAGEQYPGGFVEYGSFYDKYRILGASINIQGFVNTNSADSFVRCVCIPIMPSPDTGADSIAAMINQLDAYTFDQLMAYPQAQYRQAAIQTGGYAKYSFKFFRKTKNMLQYKDIRDQIELVSDMPSTAAAAGERPSAAQQWGYYFRVFNSTAAQQNLKHTVTMKFYMNLFQRRYTQAITST